MNFLCIRNHSIMKKFIKLSVKICLLSVAITALAFPTSTSVSLPEYSVSSDTPALSAATITDSASLYKIESPLYKTETTPEPTVFLIFNFIFLIYWRKLKSKIWIYSYKFIFAKMNFLLQTKPNYYEKLN